MNTKQVHKDDRVTSSRARQDRLLVEREIASADAMEGHLPADQGRSSSRILNFHRLQPDITLARNHSVSRPSAREILDPLTFRFFLFRENIQLTIEEALETSKPYALARRVFHPSASDPEYLPLSQQADRSQHIARQESDPPDSSSHGIGFKEKVYLCIRVLKELAETAHAWTKVSDLARQYFDPILIFIDNWNSRLSLWTSDIELGDPCFGDSSPSNLVAYLIERLEDIMSAASEIRKEMGNLGSLATQLPVKQTEKVSVEEIGEEPAILDVPMDSRDPSSSLPIVKRIMFRRKRTRQLRASSAKIDVEEQKITIDMRTLVDLTDAVLMHQASAYNNGPLAKRQQEILSIYRRFEERASAQNEYTITHPDEDTIRSPKSSSSIYSDHEDCYSQTSEQNLTDDDERARHLSPGKCDSEDDGCYSPISEEHLMENHEHARRSALDESDNRGCSEG